MNGDQPEPSGSAYALPILMQILGQVSVRRPAHTLSLHSSLLCLLIYVQVCTQQQKLRKIGDIAVFAKTTKFKWYRRYKGAQQKLRFLQFLRFLRKKLRKIGEIAIFAAACKPGHKCFDRVYIVLHQVPATQTTRACRKRPNIKPPGNAFKFLERQITRYLIKFIFTPCLRFLYSFAYL